MQFRLNAQPESEKENQDNPIFLIKEIHNITHETVRLQYIYVSIKDDRNRLINVKQPETESLLDYVAQLNKNSDVSARMYGKDVLE